MGIKSCPHADLYFTGRSRTWELEKPVHWQTAVVAQPTITIFTTTLNHCFVIQAIYNPSYYPWPHCTISTAICCALITRDQLKPILVQVWHPEIFADMWILAPSDNRSYQFCPRGQRAIEKMKLQQVCNIFFSNSLIQCQQLDTIWNKYSTFSNLTIVVAKAGEWALWTYGPQAYCTTPRWTLALPASYMCKIVSHNDTLVIAIDSGDSDDARVTSPDSQLGCTQCRLAINTQKN